MIRSCSSRSRACLAAAFGLVLAGCEALWAPGAMAQASDPQAAPIVALPPGASCTAALERWRGVIENDHRMGYVDPSVYASVERDIATAQSVCVAGRDAEAVRLVRASRRRHGYPSE